MTAGRCGCDGGNGGVAPPCWSSAPLELVGGHGQHLSPLGGSAPAAALGVEPGLALAMAMAPSSCSRGGSSSPQDHLAARCSRNWDELL